ncbi:MAG: helix-turn-helix domain-containing protein [Cellulosilyticaceae bacterium]
MTDQNALKVLKLFFYGAQSMQEISRRSGVSRPEVREILRGARSLGLISYDTKEITELLMHTRTKGLEKYLRTKGAIK